MNADSGIFLRGPQLQCRDYLVAGPYTELKNYKPQDWNEIDVVVKGDSATCTCNGEPLKFDAKLPPTGPIGLEADRGQMEFRRLRINEEREAPQKQAGPVAYLGGMSTRRSRGNRTATSAGKHCHDDRRHRLVNNLLNFRAE